MRRVVARHLLAAALLAGAGAQAAPSIGDPAPFEAIRKLQLLQDHIAEGDAIAQAAHAKAIERTARLFTRAKLATWADARNARALIAYLFSGGRAETIGDVIPATALPTDYRRLYDGAIAYGLGRDDAARDALMKIDPKSLPTGLGGHLALVQANLSPPESREKAIALLDLARLLEPGTLIEEAALRKEMSLIGPTGDVEKFAALARRYLGAFARSIYADNFRQLVAATAMQIGDANSDDAGLRLARLAATLDKPDRRRLYLAIAKAAVVSGHLRMAQVAADAAGHLTEHGSPDEARAMVYLGAATIVGDHYDAGRKALDDAANDRLSLKDKALRASAVAVADLIRKPPPLGATAPATVPSADVVADGERSLATADKMLDEASK